MKIINLLTLFFICFCFLSVKSLVAEPSLHINIGSLNLNYKNVSNLDWIAWKNNNIEEESALKIINTVNSASEIKNHQIIIEKYLYHKDFILLIGAYNPPIRDGEFTGIFNRKTLEHVGWFFTENSR